MERSQQTLDPGASSSGGSRKANEAERQIQALRRAVDQVAQLHISSSIWPNDLLAAVNYLIDNELHYQLILLRATEIHYGFFNTNITTHMKSWFPTTDMKRNDNMTKGAMDNLRRLLDSIESSIAKAYPYKKTQENDRIVANYLYRTNHFEAGDAFISEAGVPETFTLKSQYKKMHDILKALNEHEIDPAIKWIKENEGHPLLSGSRLHFNVYRQQYLQMLKDSDMNPEAALNFLRDYVSLFGSDYEKEIGKLSTCMLWIGCLDESPYGDFLSSATWENLAKDFTEKFLAIAEQPPDC